MPTNPRIGSAVAPTHPRAPLGCRRVECETETGEPRVEYRGATEEAFIDAPRGLEVDTEGVR